ncbi:MAG: hypothetical protein DI536_25180 [Archangium gephyra]|uniref:STAS domain-containing protein n=1 Tax=Archangium gephyra TaxID=48 RepID=A0A2W5T9V3_9BACT|nr:MAG: hypothetical protein DI536_25180 [Archangium gephyra]
MVRIEADAGKNRIVLILSGRPEIEKSSAFRVQLEDALARVRSPVDVLSDIRGLEELNPDLIGEFKVFGERLRAFGVRRVVRIVGRSAQAAVQVERLTRQLKGHAAHLAFSEAEAEQVFGK